MILKKLFILGLILSVATALTMGIMGCPGGNDAPTSPSSGPSGSTASTPIAISFKPITAVVGGSVGLSDGTTVVIPPNSLAQNASVTVSKYNYLSAPQNTQHLAASNYAYQINASATLVGPATIIMPYNVSSLGSGVQESNLMAEFYDGTEWVIADSEVDTVKKQVITETNHFSWWTYSWSKWLGGITSLKAVPPLPVPYQYQFSSGWCADTSGSMISKFNGVNFTSDNCTIAGFLGQAVKEGASLEEIDSYLKNQGYSTELCTWGVFQFRRNLQNYLEAGLSSGQPLIVGNKGHAIVINGYDPNVVNVTDPSGYFLILANSWGSCSSSVCPQFMSQPVSWINFLNFIPLIKYTPLVDTFATLAITGKNSSPAKTGSIQLPPSFTSDCCVAMPQTIAWNANDPKDYLSYVWGGDNGHSAGYYYAASALATTIRSQSSIYGYDFTNQDVLTGQILLNNLTGSNRQFTVQADVVDSASHVVLSTSGATTLGPYAINQLFPSKPPNVPLCGVTVAGLYSMKFTLKDETGVITDKAERKFYVAPPVSCGDKCNGRIDTWDFGQTSVTFGFGYNVAYGSASYVIYYEGTVLFDSGCLTAPFSGVQSFSFSGSSSSISIKHNPAFPSGCDLFPYTYVVTNVFYPPIFLGDVPICP